MVESSISTIGLSVVFALILWLLIMSFVMFRPFWRFVWNTLKSMMVSFCIYFSIVIVVAGCAAIVGVLTLQDGEISYLTDPQTLFWYLWHKRAGLKVQILFVSTIIYLMVTSRRVGQH